MPTMSDADRSKAIALARDAGLIRICQHRTILRVSLAPYERQQLFAQAAYGAGRELVGFESPREAAYALSELLGEASVTCPHMGCDDGVSDEWEANTL